jgi:hypothetical protein
VGRTAACTEAGESRLDDAARDVTRRKRGMDFITARKI